MTWALLAAASAAHAGDAAFIRLTCTPETGQFRIENVSVDVGDVQGDQAGPGLENRIMHTWRKRGLYEVDQLRYDCTLQGTRYQVRVRRKAYRQDGQCAQAPRINFTLLRNGIPVLQDAPYGNDCYINIGVQEIAIRETPKGTDMRLCIGDRLTEANNCMELDARYKRIGTRDGAGKHVRFPPIGQTRLEELFEQSR